MSSILLGGWHFALFKKQTVIFKILFFFYVLSVYFLYQRPLRIIKNLAELIISVSYCMKGTVALI